MDIDDYEGMVIDENDEFITPSPGMEDFVFDEKTGHPRLASTVSHKIVDKDFFNDFPDLFDDDNA
ncbi:hypothetical protein BGW38_009227 [Lunasporangiospora selenospora]|uniref:Uncharacterized protein n=1 Tax=Lunasporangiospora selenospora TaxID=979761 RepID=A0A9P6G2Z8_9FUNG|nr:hypothetical protein BGW38_009227 [Lunasporangiospora selenospora]